MKYLAFLSWVIYLLCFCYSCEGLFYQNQRDSRYRSGLNPLSSPNHHNVTDQLYSQWSKWTQCSVTCGTGIISRTRTCLKSAYNSKGVLVPLCHGDFSEHKICNLTPCSSDSASSLEQQCSQYNDQVIAGKLVKEWTPAGGGPNSCELRCESKSEKFVYGFGKTSDGTPCPFGVCLDGRCLSVGCDDRLGSGVTVDMCGICGGRNSSCVHYKDVFQGQPSSGSSSRSSYHEVVVIPMAARNLIIRQPVGKNILALQDRSKGIIFNGEQTSSKYGSHFEVAGSSVDFQKPDKYTEQLLVIGPVNQDLYVLALLRAHNPGIYYEYWLPRQIHNPSRSHYTLKPFTTEAPNLQIPTISQSYPVPPYNPEKTTARPATHHHPSKPPFAYGYGEKPYKGKEYPIFRHITTTTTSPNVEKRSYFKSPEAKSSEGGGGGKNPPYYQPVKRGISPFVKPGPVLDFYQTFRNASRFRDPDSAKVEKTVDDTRVLAQGDSSFSEDGNHRNTIPNDPVKDKYRKLSNSGSPKSGDGSITLSKREENPYKNYVPNGRLKYSVDNAEVYVNASGKYPSETLSINVLPLPDSKASGSRSDKSTGDCGPCQKSRDQTKHFCTSDFVVRASVISFEFLQGETRYELDVRQSFKNTLSLLPKEYVWSPDTCRCPKLRPGKEYLIMGRTDNTYRRRESRLLVDNTSFVRTFNLKYARRLQKLRKQQAKKCQGVS